MFEFSFNRLNFRLRVLTIVVFLVFGVAAIFGRYPYTVLNAIAVADLLIVLIAEGRAIPRLAGGPQALVTAGLLLMVCAIATVYGLTGAEYLWLAVLAIRMVTLETLRRLRRPSRSEIATAVQRAGSAPDGETDWLEPVLFEARKQVRWRAVVALHKLDRRHFQNFVEDIVKNSPDRAKKNYLAAWIISNPMHLSTYIDIGQPFTGSLQDWLKKCWASLRWGVSGTPFKSATATRSLPLSQSYAMSIPKVLDRRLLDRDAESVDLKSARRRVKHQEESYGAAGPWAHFKLGLAVSEESGDPLSANQYFLTATILAEGLLAGTIKVRSRMVPRRRMNPEFDPFLTDGGKLEADEAPALIWLCVRCRSTLARSFFEYGLVHEAELSLMEMLERIRVAPPDATQASEQLLEPALQCMMDIRLWTGSWRGIDLLMPANAATKSDQRRFEELAVSAASSVAAGQIAAARQSIQACKEIVDQLHELDGSLRRATYVAANVASSVDFKLASHFMERWAAARDEGDWNENERRLHARNFFLAVAGIEKSGLVYQAANLLAESFEITSAAARRLPEGEFHDWLGRCYFFVSSALTILVDWADESSDSDLQLAAIETLASLRSLSLSSHRFRRRLVNESGSENLRQLFATRSHLSSDLASYNFQSRISGTKDIGQRMMTDRRAVLDLMLAEYFAGQPDDELKRVYSTSDLLGTLGASEALLLFFRYAKLSPFAPGGYDGENYALAVFRRSETVRFVPLGDAKPIDDASRRAVDAVCEDDPKWLDYADSLSELLVAPFSYAVEGADKWVVCPAGRLHRVPFSLLKLGERRIADGISVRYVSTVGELFRPPDSMVKPGPPVVFGNPDFNLYDPDDTTQDLINSLPGGAELQERRMHGKPPKEQHFEPLKHAESEAVLIADMLGVKAQIGGNARESSLKSVRSPEILHIASHGYWIDGTAAANLEDVNPLATRFEASEQSHPFSRSGIALAGANWFVKDLTHADRGDDGLLSGYDVLELDLTATELVVLSACRTGEGDALGIAGAVGLRFAFAAAGARAQVTTLWPVPDHVTKDFMEAFYKQLLDGTPKSQAISNAQDAIRANPEWQEPFFWAGFVHYGDDRPISLQLRCRMAAASER